MELKLVRNEIDYNPTLLSLGGVYHVWKIDCCSNRFEDIYNFYIITNDGVTSDIRYVTKSMLSDFEVIPCIK